VVLFNLDKIRRDGIQDVFLELAQKGFSCDDQDVLNVACYGHIRHLPLHYNVMTKYNIGNKEAFFKSNGVSQCFTEEERKRAKDTPTIIHYADKEKPWNDASLDLAERWWFYAEKSPFWHNILESYAFDTIINAKMKISQLNGQKNRIINEKNKIIRAKKETEKMLRDVKNSTTFKVGRIVTFIPRKIKGLFKCLKFHGIIYTIKYIPVKIYNKIYRRK